MKLIREHINRFERGLDPKAAMHVGQQYKEKLIKLMTNPDNFPADEKSRLKFKYMINLVKDKTTGVVFEGNKISITMSSSPINVFFFDALHKNLAWSHSVECYCWDNPKDNVMEIWIKE